MASMIQEESEQYKPAAISYYEKDRKASKSESDRSVDGHLKSQIARIIAMDKAGMLEAYIDRCPQLEDHN